MKRTTRRRAVIAAVSCLTLLGAAAGTALAAPSDHTAIVLKNPGGAAITKNADGSAAAFSMKATCFGATGCHGDASGGGKEKFTYDQIERHSYHAQLGANEIRGYNPFNIDSSDPWRTGAGPQGKNWVQSPGHVGSW